MNLGDSKRAMDTHPRRHTPKAIRQGWEAVGRGRQDLNFPYSQQSP